MILDPTINTKIQINHPELLIGPVDGHCSNTYDQLNKPSQSTRFTTANFCFNESEPLVPNGVTSKSLNQDGGQDIKPLCYPVSIFKLQNGLMYIGGEIIN